MLTDQFLKKSGIKFGTSGARGLVDQFTDQVCAAFTIVFINIMRQDYNFSRISIAMDRRPSSSKMALACYSAARKLELEVDYFGILPTPALAYHAIKEKQPAIMITGSHIPFDRNGIKFYRPDGEINKQDEQRILTAQIEIPPIQKLDHLPNVNSNAESLYLKRNCNLVHDGLLKGKRVGIYQHSSAGRDFYTKIFSLLGAQVIPLGRTEEFVPIDTEAVSEEDVELAQMWAKTEKLNFLFSTDGDGDRPLIADENGQWLRGDIVGLLTARFLGVEALAVPVSCNTAIEVSRSFNQILRTKIGSPYVIEAMSHLSQTHSCVAGFEANGGFLLGSEIQFNGKTLDALPTRDALLPILALMACSINSNKTLSQLVADLPSRYTASNRIENFDAKKSTYLIDAWSKDPKQGLKELDLENKVICNQDEIDGLRWTFDDQTIVHLRPSGNAPEFRCYIEAESDLKAQTILSHVCSQLKKINGK
jgi:phosphomannomutase